MKIADHAATPYLVAALIPFAVGRYWWHRYFHRKHHAAKAISRNSFDRMIAGGVMRLPSTVNRPKIQKGSGTYPRAPANETGVPLKYFLVPTVFSQASRKFFCKKKCAVVLKLFLWI